MKVEESISDNKIEFEYNNNKYRVVQPSYKEKMEANKRRLEKQIAMLKEKDENGNFKYMSEKDLYLLYKERGIDLQEYDRKIELLKNRELELSNQLGKALKEKEQGKEAIKKEIEEVRDRVKELIMDKTYFLEVSIEQQVNVFLYSYFTSIMTEVYKDNKWVKVWNSFDEYENEEDEKLLNLAISYSTLLIINNG